MKLRGCLVATILIVALGSFGCESDGTGGGGTTPVDPVDLPNVYQPETEDSDCEKIEYQWDTKDGIKNTLVDGSGGYCLYMENPPKRARCITRGPDESITVYGLWVESSIISKEQMENLCPSD